MVTPTARREVGCWLVSEKGVRQRRACRLVGVHRSVARYRHRHRHRVSGPIRDRLKDLAGRHRRYGYLRLHVLLRREGFAINRKRTYRLYRDEGLAVRTRKRQAAGGPERVPLAAVERRNQRWSMDFVSDSLCSGRRFRILNIVDEHTRESPGQLVDLSISGERVARLLDRLAVLHGLPEETVMDNGPGQRSGIHQQGPFPVVAEDRRPTQVHSARQAHAERLRRELQRQFPRRMPERKLVRQLGRSPSDHREVAPPL